MKTTTYIIASLACVALSSCDPSPSTPTVNTPVEPAKPQHEAYYVNADTIQQKFSPTRGIVVEQAPEVMVKLNYNGNVVAYSKHNTEQAKAIATATNSANLSNTRFAFIIKSASPNMQQKQSLLNFLTNNGVQLHQLEILSEATSSTEASPATPATTPAPVLTQVLMRKL